MNYLDVRYSGVAVYFRGMLSGPEHLPSCSDGFTLTYSPSVKWTIIDLEVSGYRRDIVSRVVCIGWCTQELLEVGKPCSHSLSCGLAPTNWPSFDLFLPVSSLITFQASRYLPSLCATSIRFTFSFCFLLFQSVVGTVQELLFSFFFFCLSSFRCSLSSTKPVSKCFRFASSTLFLASNIFDALMVGEVWFSPFWVRRLLLPHCWRLQISGTSN